MHLLLFYISVAVFDPIKKRKKELEDERLPEFAPPSSYFKNEKSSSNQSTNPTAPFTTIRDDSVYNSVNAEFSNTINAPSYQLPPLFSRPIPSTSSDPVTEVVAGTERNKVAFSTEDKVNENNSMNSSAQKPNDSIRESVTEVLRYYKTKYTVND